MCITTRTNFDGCGDVYSSVKECANKRDGLRCVVQTVWAGSLRPCPECVEGKGQEEQQKRKSDEADSGKGRKKAKR